MATKANAKPKATKAIHTRRSARVFRAALSKDGKHWLLRDTTTWFIPVNHLRAIQKSASAKIADMVTAEFKENGGPNGRSH